MTPPGSRTRLLFPVLSIGDPSGVQERVCFPVLSIGDPSGVQNAFAVPCASDRWPLRRPERVCFPVLAIGDPAGVRGEETGPDEAGIAEGVRGAKMRLGSWLTGSRRGRI